MFSFLSRSEEQQYEQDAGADPSHKRQRQPFRFFQDRFFRLV